MGMIKVYNICIPPEKRTREETAPSRGPPARTKRVETAKTGLVDDVIVYNLSYILHNILKSYRYNTCLKGMCLFCANFYSI